MGVISGATIIAPITVASESATTPTPAMIAARISRTQKADCLRLLEKESVGHPIDVRAGHPRGAVYPGPGGHARSIPTPIGPASAHRHAAASPVAGESDARMFSFGVPLYLVLHVRDGLGQSGGRDTPVPAGP
jgi:hypothetical protein